MTALPLPAKSSAGDARIQQPCQSCREDLAPRIEGFLSLGVPSAVKWLLFLKARFNSSELVYVPHIFCLKIRKSCELEVFDFYH